MEIKIIMTTFFALLSMLMGLSKSEKIGIDCDYNLETFGLLENIKRCKAEKIDPITVDYVDININNLHTTHNHQFNPGKIEGFIAENKTTFYFPENVGNHFPFLKAVKVKNCKLRKISSKSLEKFQHLEYLDLSYNQLLVLERNLFQNNINLAEIWLNHNKIYHIDPTAFSGLNNLKLLNLGENTCYSVGASNLQDALAISKQSLCSDDLLHVCGAFSHAFERIRGASAGMTSNYANNVMQSGNLGFSFSQSSSSSASANSFNSEGICINLTDILTNKTRKIFAEIQNTNNTQSKFSKIISDNVDDLKSKIEQVLKMNNSMTSINSTVVKLEELLKDMNEKLIEISSKFNKIQEEKNAKALSEDVVMPAVSSNDSNSTKCHTNATNSSSICQIDSPPDFKSILIISLFSFIILLLIVNITLFCQLRKHLMSSEVRELVKNGSQIYNKSITQNGNKAKENHFQMNGMKYNKGTNEQNQHPFYGGQQDYEEILENPYNQSQMSYGRATNENNDDFYSEEQHVEDTYSEVNDKKSTENYATVYNPAKNVMKVNNEDDKMLYS